MKKLWILAFIIQSHHLGIGNKAWLIWCSQSEIKTGNMIVFYNFVINHKMYNFHANVWWKLKSGVCARLGFTIFSRTEFIRGNGAFLSCCCSKTGRPENRRKLLLSPESGFHRGPHDLQIQQQCVRCCLGSLKVDFEVTFTWNTAGMCFVKSDFQESHAKLTSDFLS